MYFFNSWTILTRKQSELTSKYIHDTAKIRKFLLQKIPGFNVSHGYVPKKGLKIPDIYINRQDTSCPLAQNEKGRIDKMPNLIAVGFAKCGTGSLSFLDCHSQIGKVYTNPVAEFALLSLPVRWTFIFWQCWKAATRQVYWQKCSGRVQFAESSWIGNSGWKDAGLHEWRSK